MPTDNEEKPFPSGTLVLFLVWVLALVLAYFFWPR
jgi:hypothetical protein